MAYRFRQSKSCLFLRLLCILVCNTSNGLQNCAQRRGWKAIPSQARQSSILQVQVVEAVTGNTRCFLKNADCTVEEAVDLNGRVIELCRSDAVDDAVRLVQHYLSDASSNDHLVLNPSAVNTVISNLSVKKDCAAYLDQMTDLLSRMNSLDANGIPEWAPTASTYNSVALAWSKSFRDDAGQRCDELLTDLWRKYNTTSDDRFVPLKSMYVATLTALARSRKGQAAAQRTEELLEEMERMRQNHPSLAPTTICVNIVLHAWSQSGARMASRRSEAILERMEYLYLQGRKELQPNTTSFNTVIDALARSNEHGKEQRAEALLEHMQQLSEGFEELRESCRPDAVSFNTVLNCWARSRDPSSAKRADDILRHMERRFKDGHTDVRPNRATFNTVLTAWSRSKAKDATIRAEEALRRMEKAFRAGNSDVRPNAMSYNILINAWAKSKAPDASSRALELFETMKLKSREPGREDCAPDVFTYTTLIDVLAKSASPTSADQAVALLEEAERLFNETDHEHLKPNIRTYTAVIHTIARSRVRPERAEDIVNRLERLYTSGASDVQPDVVCYDALMNAFGWSEFPGKARKCFEIYQTMLKAYRNGVNPQAKPDIIACNAILNACAYQDVRNDFEREEVMKIAVQTFEEFQSAAPRFGWPNHITYANMLMNINKHVLDPEKRSNLAEATFWQCCKNGHVSVLVLMNLRQALPWERFADLLGPALLSQENEALHFHFGLLPSEWTRFSPSPKEKRNSPGRKQPSKRISR